MARGEESLESMHDRLDDLQAEMQTRLESCMLLMQQIGQISMQLSRETERRKHSHDHALNMLRAISQRPGEVTVNEWDRVIVQVEEFAMGLVDQAHESLSKALAELDERDKRVKELEERIESLTN